MPPKRKATLETPQPRRKSARLNPAVEPEPPETWPELARLAKERINRYASASSKKARKGDEKLKPCMIALLDWLPEEGRESAAHDMLKSITDDMLYDMFQNIRTCLLFPMKAAGSSSVSRTPIAKREEDVEIVASIPEEEPQKQQDKFRADILRRDNHRCVITNGLDRDKWLEMGEPDDIDCEDLDAAHIIPFPLASWKATPGSTHDVSQIWETLFRYFPGIRHIKMGIENINHRSNGITLRDDVHKSFGNFAFSFVPTETPHIYDLKTYRRAISGHVKREIAKVGRVTLQQANGAEDVPLPSAVLLDCHWRVAEILNASGMGEEFDRHWREWEDIKMSTGDDCLKEDGSTDVTRYLEVAFWNLVDQAVSC
ncbi:hypothetical protein DTO021C3_287 [Paecilomyces variotii]|nr:hypothetical protein DTO021C3_287 [Paecilomyces variotii]